MEIKNLKFDDGSDLRKSAKIDIPSKLEDGELDETPEEYEKMRGYDHSLEINRWEKLQREKR